MADNPASRLEVIFGPHCDHEDCSWIACDGVPAGEDGILCACRHQEVCPHCGPASPSWRRLAAEWLEWCQGWAATVSSSELAAKNVPANVVATALLVETHYRPE